MTKDEALKLALDALETSMYPQQKQLQAITAIKEALAQPEQEPVAWMFQHEETGRMMFVEAQQLEWGFEKGNPRLKKIGPLYTTPPQRTWVGLTDKEIEQGCKESWVTEQAWQSAVWWAEAALKDKNT